MKNIWFHTLENILSELLPLYNDVYLLGDFNVNLLTTGDSLFNSFSAILSIFMLYNVSVAPTRAASGTLLDLFLISNPTTLHNFYQTNVDWSDHDAIFLSCDINKCGLSLTNKWIRNFKSIDESNFLSFAAQLDWSSIMYVSGVNEKIEQFYVFLRLLLDTFAPKKLIKFQENKSLNDVENWITDDILQKIDERK